VIWTFSEYNLTKWNCALQLKLFRFDFLGAREEYGNSYTINPTVLSYVKAGVINITGNICAYDLNEPLIYLYKNVQTNHNELYDEIQKLIIEYNECSGTAKNFEPQTIMEGKQSKENSVAEEILGRPDW
jgi:hypothetical protein